jgi:drug/metabolite transporter (DMT)-like permease
MQTKLISRADFSGGYLLAFLSAVALSFTAVLIRYLTLTYEVPALVLAFWRNFFVIVTVLPVLLLAKNRFIMPDRSEIKFFAGYGLVLAFFNAFWTISVAMNGAAVATILVYCSAAFAVLADWYFMQEPVSRATAVSVGLCLAGCCMVSGVFTLQHNHAGVIGIVTGLLSGLAYCLYSLAGRVAAQRGFNAWVSLFCSFFFAAVFLLILNLLPGALIPGAAQKPADIFWLGSAVKGWAVLFLLAAGPTVAGFGLYTSSLKHLPASAVNLVATLEPVFAAIIAYLFLGERFNSMQTIGGIAVICGIIFLRLCDSKTADRSAGNLLIKEPAG